MSKPLDPNRLYTVYAIQCTATGRVYIGSTSNFEGRVRTHFSELRRGLKRKPLAASKTYSTREPNRWQLDYNEHGRDAFEVFVIEDEVPASKQAERETHYIKHYNSTDEEYGYNVRYSYKQPLEFVRGMPARKWTPDDQEQTA